MRIRAAAGVSRPSSSRRSRTSTRTWRATSMTSAPGRWKSCADAILMTNAAQSVPLNDDEENPILLRTPDAKTHNERLRAVASGGSLPEGVDYVFTTYSQMQKIGGDGAPASSCARHGRRRAHRLRRVPQRGRERAEVELGRRAGRGGKSGTRPALPRRLRPRA
jgi:hypothetical protein